MLFLSLSLILILLIVVFLVHDNVVYAYCIYCSSTFGDTPLGKQLNELISKTHGKIAIFLAGQALEGNYTPLKQLKYKTFGEGNVICKLDFVPIRYYDGFPVCVKPNTASILEKRGWIPIVNMTLEFPQNATSLNYLFLPTIKTTNQTSTPK